MDNNSNRRSFVVRATIVVALVAAAVIVLYLFAHVAQMLLVIFGGVLFAILLAALTDVIRRHTRIPRGVALAVVIIGLFALLTAAGWFAGPRVAQQFARLGERIPQAVDEIEQDLSQSSWGQSLLEGLSSLTGLTPEGSDLMGQITGAFSTALGAVTGVLIVLFLGIYLAADPRLYTDNAVRLLPRGKRERAREILDAAGRGLRWWLVGRVASMIVVGILTAASLWIAGVPLPLSLGLLAATLAFVPFIGPILSAIPAILVALTEDPVLAVWVVIIYAGVQLLESYVITPLIQQKAVYLPPALLITMEILMAVLFGAVGILLAAPLSVVIIVAIQMLYVEDVVGEKVRVMGKH
jgi:predicted PurR-regulated permease PerM